MCSASVRDCGPTTGASGTTSDPSRTPPSTCLYHSPPPHLPVPLPLTCLHLCLTVSTPPPPLPPVLSVPLCLSYPVSLSFPVSSLLCTFLSLPLCLLSPPPSPSPSVRCPYPVSLISSFSTLLPLGLFPWFPVQSHLSFHSLPLSLYLVVPLHIWLLHSLWFLHSLWLLHSLWPTLF